MHLATPNQWTKRRLDLEKEVSTRSSQWHGHSALILIVHFFYYFNKNDKEYTISSKETQFMQRGTESSSSKWFSNPSDITPKQESLVWSVDSGDSSSLKLTASLSLLIKYDNNLENLYFARASSKLV